MAPSPSTTTTSVPATMRAWTFNRKGSPVDTLTLLDVPAPSPAKLAPDQVLVRTSYVGLNLGMVVLFKLMPHFTSNPWIPELDFSGVVAATGAGVLDSEFEIGDEVCGAAPLDVLLRSGGALAEYVVCRVGSLVRKPKALGWAEAAALPACGATCFQAVELARVQKGQRVLITAGSSGLGHMLVQVCRAVVGGEGEVISTCSERNRTLVMGLGADEVIDYTKHNPLHEHLSAHYRAKPFDAIFDIAGDKSLHHNCPKYLTDKGMFVMLGAMGEVENPSWWGMLTSIGCAKLERFRPVLVGGVPRDHRMMNGIPDRQGIEKAIRLAEEGKLKVVIDSIWGMEDIVKGYEKALTLRARGKIICKTRS